MSTAEVSSAATRGSAITSAAELPTAKRVVIKIGSSSLTTVSGGISVEALHSLVGPASSCASTAPKWCWSLPVRSLLA